MQKRRSNKVLGLENAVSRSPMKKMFEGGKVGHLGHILLIGLK